MGDNTSTEQAGFGEIADAKLSRRSNERLLNIAALKRMLDFVGSSAADMNLTLTAQIAGAAQVAIDLEAAASARAGSPVSRPHLRRAHATPASPRPANR